jgi:hypothetical protein
MVDPFARTPRCFTTGRPSSAYRLLSDQVSDYGVDAPYIQAHIHGLSSRSVLYLDDSLTVLRDEEVTTPSGARRHGCRSDRKTRTPATPVSQLNLRNRRGTDQLVRGSLRHSTRSRSMKLVQPLAGGKSRGGFGPSKYHSDGGGPLAPMANTHPVIVTRQAYQARPSCRVRILIPGLPGKPLQLKVGNHVR